MIIHLPVHILLPSRKIPVMNRLHPDIVLGLVSSPAYLLEKPYTRVTFSSATLPVDVKFALQKHDNNLWITDTKDLP